VGDRVNGSGMGGIFAEVNNFPAANVNKVADTMDLESAAIFPVNYLTAWHALVDRARAQKGESLLVLGAAGGTGFAAIQVGKHLGLRVIASASSDAKRAAALAGGADAAVTTGAEDWRDQVKAANGGKPIDVVFDPVGGDMTDMAFRTLGYDGRHLVIGFPAGLTALKTNLPLLKCASLVGVQVRGAGIERPEVMEADRKAVQEMVRAGVVKPAIARRYRLEDYAEAMNVAFKGSEAGRIVLTMD
jgi:NADPH2:quinone reductase